MPESKINLMWEMYGNGDSLRTIANTLGVPLADVLVILDAQPSVFD